MEPPLDRYVGPTWCHHVGATLIQRVKLRWADVDYQRWANEANVDRLHCVHVEPTYQCYLGKFMTTHQKSSVCTLASSVFLSRIFHENDQIPGERIDRIHYSFV